ncbi:hypothetical protein Hamer_G025088 [Homarus americanus]|uniref:Uncharacterized protein n=1 Tax=Homarus americanus TaxID=6706 RepID=A0A8J5N494_HOMAM|nr:hypothetical protein Hamer_G025088 [Homarus americanus]
MRVGGVTLVWVAWSCVGVMLVRGGGVAEPLLRLERDYWLLKAAPNNQSTMSIAFLAFRVILFDVLPRDVRGDFQHPGGAGANGVPGQIRRSPGLDLGDNLNNLAEVVNKSTIYLYRDETRTAVSVCCEETNKPSATFTRLSVYTPGSRLFLPTQAPLSRNLEATRSGRKGQNCIKSHPKPILSESVSRPQPRC